MIAAWLLRTRAGHLALPLVAITAGYFAGSALGNPYGGLALGGAGAGVLHAALWRKIGG